MWAPAAMASATARPAALASPATAPRCVSSQLKATAWSRCGGRARRHRPRDLTAKTPHRLLPVLLLLQDMRFWPAGEGQLTAVYNTWCALCAQAWAPRPHRPDPQRFRIYVYELPLPLALAEQLDFGQMHVNLEFYQAWR